MKTKILFTLLALIFSVIHVYGQAHDNSKGGCKLAKNHVSTGYTCPACVAIDKREQAARDLENKRKNDAIVAKANEAEKARQIALKKEQAERAAKNKVTEVFVKMPSASSSSNTPSSGSPSSSTSSSANTSSSSSEPSNDTGTSSSEVTVYNNIFAAENARKYNEQKVIGDAAKLMGDFFDNWQANREKKWAREKQEDENHNEKVSRDQYAYSSFVSDQNSIFKNFSTYQAMIKTMLPKVLNSKSITWEEIIGAPEYNNLFGKDIKSVSKKLKITLPKDKSKSAGENLSTDYLPKQFTHQDFYATNGNHEFFYWVKTDFYDHSCAYIFGHNDILIGIKIALHTSSREDKAFPSSLQEYISVKDYYDDLIKNTKGAYFLADGKTIVTRDKVFILDFKSLTIYDLNFFDANTTFNLPREFTQSFNSQNGNNYNSKLGLKFQGFRVDETKKLTKVRITEVDKNSVAEKAGLLPDDIILNINDIAIDFPFHLQWYFLAFPDEKNINLKIERAKKIENLSLKL